MTDKQSKSSSLNTFSHSPIEWLALLLLILSIVAALFYPLPIHPGLDFSQFYVDLYGILRGDAVYNQYLHASHYVQNGFARALVLNPPAYPPWYYAVFLPLGMFEIQTSARIWAEINLALLFSSLLLLTNGHSPRFRTAIAVVVMFFAPVTGHLVIGQQTMILLLGVSCLLRGVERGSSPTTAAGLLLLTFKPHLGLPIAIMGICWLLLKHSPLAISTLVRSMLGFSALLCLSLLLDPYSLTDYPDSLHRLSALSLNQLCDTCSSLTLTIQRNLSAQLNGLWAGRFVIGLILALILIIPLFLLRLADRSFFSASVCVTLLVAPYIRNYDYVLLLAPLIALTSEGMVRSRERKSRRWDRHALCGLAFLVAGVLPLLTPREYHQHFFWISAALTYCASLLKPYR